MSGIHAKYLLNENNIDNTSREIFQFLKEEKYSKEVLLSARLSLETILLEWLEHGGSGKSFEVETKKSFGRLHIYLRLEGGRIEHKESKNDQDFFNTIQERLSAILSVQYLDDTNIADIKLPRKEIGGLGKIAIAIALACIFGNILPMFMADAALKSINKGYIMPTFSTIIGVLGGFALFQVFFSIIDSIISTGNIAILKSIGAKYLKIALVTLSGATLFSTIIMLFFFPVLSSSGAGSDGSLGMIYKLMLGIFPTNIANAFVTGNMLQIVFLAVFLGIILLILRAEVSNLYRDISDINRIFNYALFTINKMVPVFIFLSFLSLIISGKLALIFSFWSILAVYYLVCVVITLFIIIATSFYTKLPAIDILKRSSKLFLLGASTTSSIACLPLLRNIIASFKVKENISNFSINFGLIFSKHTTIVHLLLVIIFLHDLLGKSLSFGEIVILGLTCILLRIAMPSAPGGSIAILSSLALQYGIPIELTATVISLDVFFDMMCTGTKMVFMLCESLLLDKVMNTSR